MRVYTSKFTPDNNLFISYAALIVLPSVRSTCDDQSTVAYVNLNGHLKVSVEVYVYNSCIV